MKKITYIFGGGRLTKLSKENDYAKEFFYGYHLVKQNKNFETSILELNPFSNIKGIAAKTILLLDKLLNKLAFLQFHFHEILKKNNYKQIKNSDILIFSTDRLAISFLPILKINKNVKSIVISMGLLKEHKNLKFYQKLIRPYIIYQFIKSVDKFIFLGEREYEFAKLKFPKFNSKFKFIPFPVDYIFWTQIKNKNSYLENSKQILFIGNDGNRNYEFLEELPKYLTNFNFKYITQQLSLSENYSNLEIINGNWSNNKISDLMMLDYYRESFLTILPIKNTIQPSGQSVTLQSLATGTPVLISKFDGFWDPSKFINNENIYFIDDFDIENWKKKIEEIYFDKIKLKYVSQNGKNLVSTNYRLNSFTVKLFDIIDEII